MQDPADSEYYWTIKIGSGEPYYLADNDGNRIKATSTVHDGRTPQLGVKQWETSDGGDDNYYWTQKIGTGPETWIEADGKKIVANAKNAVSVFEKVDLKEPDYVEFTLWHIFGAAKNCAYHYSYQGRAWTGSVWPEKDRKACSSDVFRSGVLQ